MSDVEFVDTRFDPNLTPFHDLARQLAAAFGHTADLALDPELAQLLRLRVAQQNGCAYCLILHSKKARDIGVGESRVDNLGAWWQSQLYSDAERAALAYGEALTDGNSPGFQARHDALAALFSQREIAEIAAIVINMNVWTRLKLAQGATPRVVEEAAAQ